MREKKVTTKNKQGETLFGIESLPDEKRLIYPAVILVHGFSVDKNEDNGLFQELSQKLTDRGIVTFRFDFSGIGESDGDYVETSLTKLRDDLESILTFVRSQKNINVGSIGILGQSLGSCVIMSLVPSVRAIALTGSVAYPKERLTAAFGDGYNPKGISKRFSKTAQRTVVVGPQFWAAFDQYDLIKNITLIKCPILFIHGERDEKVPVSEMEQLYEAANEPKKKIILKGASHSLQPKQEEMYKLAVDWFTKTL